MRLLLALLVSLVLPATASATIVVQKGFSGIRLGMTQAQVEAKLGTPEAVNHPSSEIFGGYTELEYDLRYFSLFAGEDGKVFSMSTTSKKEHTSKGVGVGSTEASVKKNVPKVKCVTEFGTRHCHVGEFLAGKVVTDFFISKKHRVKRVVIGRVID